MKQTTTCRLPSLEVTDPELKASLAQIHQYASGIMKDSIEKHYTDHSVRHLERVQVLVDKLLCQNSKQDLLTESERYVLRASAFLHDIGMQAEKQKQQPKERRQAHHLITSDLITHLWQKMGLLQHYASIVALVASGHRGNIDKRYYHQTVGTGNTIRCDLLAALLYLGDELDISYERVDVKRLDYLEIPPKSLLHFYRHHFTQGVDILDNRCLGITFRYPFERKNQYHPLFGKRVVDKLNTVLKEVNPILQEKHGIMVGIRQEDIRIVEDPTLDAIDPDCFERLSQEAQNIRNYLSLKSMRFKDSEGDVIPELFYTGNVRWADVVNDLDIRRAQYQSVIDKLTALYAYACKAQCPAGFLICGEGGSGKTTVLMRLAYDMTQMDEFHDINLLWLPTDSTFNYAQLRQLYYATLKPVVVFIDGVGIDQTVELAKAQMTGDNLRGVPIVLVFASRLNEWDNAKGSEIPFKAIDKLQLETLTDGEMRALLSNLEKYGQLHELEPLSAAERFSRLKERSGGQLLVAMLEATRGKRFYEIVLSEYENLKKDYPEAAKAYEYICLFYVYDVLIPEELLITLVDCSDLDEFQELVLHRTRLVIVQHPSTRYGKKYRPRHHTIATVLIDSILRYRGQDNRLRRATVVLRQIQPMERDQRYVILDFILNLVKDAKYGPRKDYEDYIDKIGNFVRKNYSSIERFHICSVEESYIPELILWSKLLYELRLKKEQIAVLKRIIQVDPNNKETNYRLAKILSRTALAREHPEQVAGYYYRSYLSNNRHMLFLYEYLGFCLRNKLYKHLDQVVGSFSDFVSFSPEEHSLRPKIKALLDGYKIVKDRDKLARDFTELTSHLKATADLKLTEELAYIDLIESEDPVKSLGKYETYLLTIQPNRPKSLLLRIARLASKIPGQEKKAVEYYEEIYDTYIKPDPQAEGFEIAFQYVLLCVEHGFNSREHNYGLFRTCINLKESDLRAYYEFSSYALSYNDYKMAKSIAEGGLDVAKKIGRYTSKYGRDLRGLLTTIEQAREQ